MRIINLKPAAIFFTVIYFLTNSVFIPNLRASDSSQDGDLPAMLRAAGYTDSWGESVPEKFVSTEMPAVSNSVLDTASDIPQTREPVSPIEKAMMASSPLTAVVPPPAPAPLPTTPVTAPAVAAAVTNPAAVTPSPIPVDSAAEAVNSSWSFQGALSWMNQFLKPSSTPSSPAAPQETLTAAKAEGNIPASRVIEAGVNRAEEPAANASSESAKEILRKGQAATEFVATTNPEPAASSQSSSASTPVPTTPSTESPVTPAVTNSVAAAAATLTSAPDNKSNLQPAPTFNLQEFLAKLNAGTTGSGSKTFLRPQASPAAFDSPASGLLAGERPEEEEAAVNGGEMFDPPGSYITVTEPFEEKGYKGSAEVDYFVWMEGNRERKKKIAERVTAKLALKAEFEKHEASASGTLMRTTSYDFLTGKQVAATGTRTYVVEVADVDYKVRQEDVYEYRGGQEQWVKTVRDEDTKFNNIVDGVGRTLLRRLERKGRWMDIWTINGIARTGELTLKDTKFESWQGINQTEISKSSRSEVNFYKWDGQIVLQEREGTPQWDVAPKWDVFTEKRTLEINRQYEGNREISTSIFQELIQNGQKKNRKLSIVKKKDQTTILQNYSNGSIASEREELTIDATLNSQGVPTQYTIWEVQPVISDIFTKEGFIRTPALPTFTKKFSYSGDDAPWNIDRQINSHQRFVEAYKRLGGPNAALADIIATALVGLELGFQLDKKNQEQLTAAILVTEGDKKEDLLKDPGRLKEMQEEFLGAERGVAEYWSALFSPAFKVFDDWAEAVPSDYREKYKSDIRYFDLQRYLFIRPDL